MSTAPFPTLEDYEATIRVLEYIADGKIDDVANTAMHRLEPVGKRLRDAGVDLQGRYRRVHSRLDELRKNALEVSRKAANEKHNAPQPLQEQLSKIDKYAQSLNVDTIDLGMKLLELEADTYRRIWPVLRPLMHWIGQLPSIEDKPLSQRIQSGGLGVIWNTIGMVPVVGPVTNVVGLGKSVKDILHSTIPVSEALVVIRKLLSGLWAIETLRSGGAEAILYRVELVSRTFEETEATIEELANNLKRLEFEMETMRA